MDLTIPKEWEGKTLLSVIRCELKVSMAALKHLKFIDRGIMLNGEHATVRRVVKEGDILTLRIEDFEESSEKLTPCDLPIRIAYEDSEVVVPDKPTNMPTHPSHGHYTDTVANALAYRYEKMGVPFVFRPINRLDRNTGGLLLVARTRLSAARLSDAMKNGEIKKRYVALLDGALPDDEGVIDTYMRRTAESIIVRENCAEGEGGDRAITEYKVIARNERYTFVSASPITGRTHQLRVHFSGLGFPITGDDMYGSPHKSLQAHALQSYYLEFPHPTTSERVSVKAPLREDMRKLCAEVFDEEDIKVIDNLFS